MNDTFYGVQPRRRSRVEPGLQEHTYPPNRSVPASGMDNVQRVVSGLGGAALLYYGLSQQGATRLALAAIGGGLLYQGASGQNLLDLVPVLQDVPVVQQLTSSPPPARNELRVRKSVTVNRPANELYEYWRDLSNLPKFMQHVKSVEDLGDGRSHWVVNVVSGMEMEWDAKITVDRPNEMIAWETLPEATIQNRGYVKFIPTDRGTEVSVSLDYDPPGAAAGKLAGSMMKFIAEQEVKEEIRSFKRLMEAGELPTTKGQPSARRQDRKDSKQQDHKQMEAPQGGYSS